MRVLLAFDKFKDALTAREACEVAARTLAAKHADWHCDLCPLTDGGEGFGDILTHAAGGQRIVLKVSGPRNGSIEAPLGLVKADRLPATVRASIPLADADTLAVVEMAGASGLALLPPGQRDPWHTTTFGTGQLIRAAAERQSSAILLGIGGSATNDLGLGALAALGFEFRTTTGGIISPPVPATWEQIARIEGKLSPSLPPVFIACDVSNPLLGPQGATAIYGPQKGLRAGDLPRLEAAVASMARRLCEYCSQPPELITTPGTGAAGGISFGLMAAAQARLLPGFDLVSGWLDLSQRIAAADLVITGEGRFDQSSLSGKGPGSIYAEARRMGKQAHVFAGSLGVPAADSLHAITPPGMPLSDALRRTAELLAAALSQQL
ncbi:MAG: glycerate kinase [Opitutaceae bacterium]|nr:glycerate kinase [Opitutaceae bacterium]